MSKNPTAADVMMGTYMKRKTYDNNLKKVLERLGIWDHVVDSVAARIALNNSDREFLVDLGDWHGEGWNAPTRARSDEPADGGYFDEVCVKQGWIENIIDRAVSYGMNTDFFDDINYRLSEERMNDHPY